ncbi:MAG: DUF2950 domain-containing protein [Verrucomicrobia bacterium]|nr:DUF2950 domain-containing protein [Verrucomicrobiota bacterium]
MLCGILQAAEPPQTFDRPDEAAAALRAAVQVPDASALRRIFGSEGDYLVSADPVSAARESEAFARGMDQGYHWVPAAAGRQTLEVGTNSWPFPVPLVQENGRWQFDPQAGREEILDRRIGANELKVLQSLRAYVAAQREYAGEDRNGDDVLEYARKFISTPGLKDGLYWPLELDGTESPMGPAIAEAQTEGYRFNRDSRETPQPFHGYYFRILTRQGRHTPAGAYNYLINGHMIGGFAAVAWPAEYGETGVMTFLVNQQGRVYQRDLGPKTQQIASRLREYDVGEGWTVSPD